MVSASGMSTNPGPEAADDQVFMIEGWASRLPFHQPQVLRWTFMLFNEG